MISIAGVLVAGSAAALVNTQVLSGSASPSALVVDDASPTQPSIDTTVSATTPIITAPLVETAATPPPAPVATQAIYAIGTSGTVTLDTAGDVLTIIDVTPAQGWTITKSEREDSTNVEIKFQSGSIEVEFHANLLFGVVTTSVESDDQSASSNSTSNSVDDHGGDDDDDDHSDDDD
jgi:hypothetical protein